MNTLVDSNVLLDVFTSDPEWLPWSQQQLFGALQGGAVIINPIIYAEISAAFAHESELGAVLDKLGIERRPLPWSAGFTAMRAFISYRRRGGDRRSPLPDFYIGAQAEVEKLSLITRDAVRYRSYFPAIRIISPD